MDAVKDYRPDYRIDRSDCIKACRGHLTCRLCRQFYPCGDKRKDSMYCPSCRVEQEARIQAHRKRIQQGLKRCG